MIKKVIRITLKSDLCAYSGYSYAGVIDSDTSYDALGLPFISGRRIKGCLREISELLAMEPDELFGKAGQSGLKEEETKIAIYDAKIENYEMVAKAIQCAIGNKELTSDDVLAQYLGIKAQTKIGDNGVAEDNSFRFTRVVNHYNPLNGEEFVFEAPVEIYSNELVKDFEKVVKGLRHIGLKRNRGLGNVCCTLEDMGQNSNSVTLIKDNSKEKQMVRLSYTIRTDSPLMISKNSDDETESYINGQTVLGYFASRYLYGNEADATFDELFLKNKLVFSPLYPSDAQGGTYYPVPSNICKLKKSGYIVNTSVQFPSATDDWKINPFNGNQPKKLKGKYMKQVGSNMAIKEVDTEIIYHNRHGEDKKLYSATAICEGQYFSGSIVGSYAHICILKEILEKYNITLGKSRKAQYGKCSLVLGEIADVTPNVVTYKAGERILVTLRSDAIFMDACGYTVRTDEVRNSIKATLGIKENAIETTYTEIEVKELTGYYGVWNLKRQAIPCVCAGSTFEYVLTEDCAINLNAAVGEKCGEGFGMTDISRNGGQWLLSKSAGEENSKVEASDLDVIKPLLIAKRIEDIKAMILKEVNAISGSHLNASSVGRLTLMLNEAVNENRDNIMSVAKALEKRIRSIKSEKQDEAWKLYQKYYKFLKEEDVAGLEEQLVEELRIYTLKEALVMLKYKNKEKGGQ